MAHVSQEIRFGFCSGFCIFLRFSEFVLCMSPGDCSAYGGGSGLKNSSFDAPPETFRMAIIESDETPEPAIYRDWNSYERFCVLRLQYRPLRLGELPNQTLD